VKHALRRFVQSPVRLLLAVAVIASCFSTTLAAKHPAPIDRVAEDIRYLASDELEGRGPGTKGLKLAADYIARRFTDLGLTGTGKDGTMTRPFELSIGTAVIEKKTHLVLTGPDGKALKLDMGKDFQPLATGGSGKAEAEVVFAGYGISAPKLEYDDYQHADVNGKVVLIIRREPQQGDEESVFDGKRVTSHAYIRTKLQAAKENKAAAVLMVNDPFTTKKEKKDELNSPDGFGATGRDIPFAHVSQQVVNRMLTVSPLTAGDEKLSKLSAVSRAIDAQLKPLTRPLDGWTAELQFDFETVKSEVTNVVGVLEGEGRLADETIVIGAHYDHLGYGPYGSRRPGERAIHNGADDNATGTAAVLELARRFAEREKKPARRLVFIGFTAEERGIVGSSHYLEKPLFPLKDTVAMLNFDMIGHLKDDGLLLGGVTSAKEFDDLVDEVIESGDLKVKNSLILGGSDHLGFYRKGIPVLFFFTGMTDLYHTPDDDFETINVEGAVKTVDFAERVIDELLEMPDRPQFVKSAKTARPGGGAMAYLGVVPDYAGGDGKGLRLTDINGDSPAGKAGLQPGDVITQFGDIEVADIYDLANGLRKYKAGQNVEITVRRDDDVKTLSVTLGEPRGGR